MNGMSLLKIMALAAYVVCGKRLCVVRFSLAYDDTQQTLPQYSAGG